MRVGGTKRYREGPVALSATVDWNRQPRAAMVDGSFTVPGSEIKVKALPEWEQAVEILLTVRTGRFRRAVFPMPYSATATTGSP